MPKKKKIMLLNNEEWRLNEEIKNERKNFYSEMNFRN